MCQKAPQHDHPTVSAIKGVTVAACIGRLLLVSRHVRRRTFTHSNSFLLPTVTEIVGPRQKLSRDPVYTIVIRFISDASVWCDFRRRKITSTYIWE